MDMLGFVLCVLILYALWSPEKFGKWLRDIKRGFDSND